MPWGPTSRTTSSPFVSLHLPNGLFSRLHLIKYKRAAAVHPRELELRALAGPLLLLHAAHRGHLVHADLADGGAQHFLHRALGAGGAAHLRVQDPLVLADRGARHPPALHLRR